MRTRTVLATVLVLTPLLFLGASAYTAPPCPGFQDVPGQGPSCPVEGGWRVLLADGTSLLTHGGDRAPPAPNAGSHGSYGYAARVRPACVENPTLDYHIQVIYARPVTGPDRYAGMADEIRNMVYEANGKINTEAGPILDWRLRVACEGGTVDVDHVVVPTLSSSASFATVVEGVRRYGYVSPVAKYWIWWDGPNSDGWGGFANIDNDPQPGPANSNNRGPMYAVTFGQYGWGGAHIMLHEIGHNLGAVIPSAPKATGGFHCNDGQDVMCYADGSSGSNYNPNVCSGLPFDCNQDSYFNMNPPAGSWLATHWNLGSPIHRFFQGCDYETGRLVTGLAGQHQTGVTHDVRDITPHCEGRRFALTAPNQDDVDVCWLNASGTTLRCDRTLTYSGAVLGTVPTGAVQARIEYPRIAGAQWVLSVQ